MKIMFKWFQLIIQIKIFIYKLNSNKFIKYPTNKIIITKITCITMKKN